MSSIIESGCPEATEEVSGVVEQIIHRVISSLSHGVCPITNSMFCVNPDDCPGCKPIMEEMLRSLVQ